MPDKRFDNDPEQFRFLQDGAVTPPDASRLWNKLEEQLDWPEQVREAVGEASHTPPPRIWEAIEAELDDKKPVFALWQKIAAALLILALTGGIGGYFFFNPLPLGQQPRDTHNKIEQFGGDEKPSTEKQHTTATDRSLTEKKTNKQVITPPTGQTETSVSSVPPTHNPSTTEYPVNPPTKQLTTPTTDKNELRPEPISMLVPLEYVFGPVGSPKLLHLEKRPTSATEASEQETPATEEKRWFIWVQGGGGEFRPNYSGDFSERSVGVVPADGDDLREVLTRGVAGTTRSYGGELGRHIGKRWLLTSGLYYIRSNYTVNTNFYRDISSSDFQSGGFRVEYESQFQHQQEWLSVPLTVGYRVGGNKRLDAILQTGLSADWMFHEDRIDIYPEYHYKMGKTSGLHLNALLGAQLRYALLPGRRLRLVLSGRYESTLGSQLEARDVRRSPERYQFGLGVQWGF